MSKYIKKSHLKLKKDNRPNKSGHEVCFGRYKPKNNKKISIVYKKNKDGNPQASVIEVALSALFHHDLPGQSPQMTRLVKEKEQITGVAVQTIKQFTTLRAIRDADNLDTIYNNITKSKYKKHTNGNHPRELFSDSDVIIRLAILKSILKKIPYLEALDETHQELARCLAVSYFYEEDDLHAENIGIDKYGTIYRIDFDMAFYEDITSKRGQMRMYPGLSDDRFTITENDLRNFPDTSDANIHYWPTKQRILTGGLPFSVQKGYSAADNEAFKKLKNNAVFKQELYNTLLSICLTNTNEYQASLNEVIDDIPLRDCLLRVTVARQKYLLSVLLTVRDEFTEEQLHQAQTIPGFNKLQENDSPLHIALKTGHYQSIESCSKFRNHINTKNKNDETPLMIAVKENNVVAARELIEHGAIFSRSNETHLPVSLLIAIEESNFHIVELLLQHNAINYFCSKEKVFELIKNCVGNLKYDLALKLIEDKFNNKITNTLIKEFNQQHPNDIIAQTFFSLGSPQLEQESLLALLKTCEEHQQYYTTLKIIQQHKLPSENPATKLSQAIIDAENKKENDPKLQPDPKLTNEQIIEILSGCEKHIIDGMSLKFSSDAEAHRRQTTSILKEVIARKPDLNNTIALLQRSAKVDWEKMLNERLDEIQKNNENYTLKQKKQKTLTCLKYYLPKIEDPQALTNIHRKLESHNYSYLRELTSSFWFIRKYRKSHGLTTTYKTIVSLMKNRSREIIKNDKAHKKENKKNLRSIRKDKNTWGLFFSPTDTHIAQYNFHQKNKAPENSIHDHFHKDDSSSCEPNNKISGKEIPDNENPFSTVPGKEIPDNEHPLNNVFDNDSYFREASDNDRPPAIPSLIPSNDGAELENDFIAARATISS